MRQYELVERVKAYDPGADRVMVVTPEAIFELHESKLAGHVHVPACEGCEHRSYCPGIRPDYLEVYGDAEIAGARTKLLDYAVSNPSDTAMRKSAVADLQTAVRGKFEAEIAGHTAKIRDAYVIELKDFMALNRSKQAAAKMQSVVERVADTLRTLRRESLDLLK